MKIYNFSKLMQLFNYVCRYLTLIIAQLLKIFGHIEVNTEAI